MRRWLIALLFVPGVAFAQAPTIDPRLAPAAMDLMRAQLALSAAALKAMQEDAAKREAEWAEYSKSLWQASEK